MDTSASPSRKPTFSDLIPLWILLFLGARPYLSGKAVTFFGDTFYYFYPLRFALWRAFQALRMPFWESDALSGNPFCANPQGNCFYPLSFLYLVPDFWSAYHLALVVHLAIGSTGMWLWLRGRGLGRPALLFAALSIALSGQTFSMLNRLDKFQTLMWWPWLMVFVDRLSVGRSRAFVGIVGSLSLAFLAGGLELWAMMVGAVPVFVLLASPPSSTDRRSRPGAPSPRPSGADAGSPETASLGVEPPDHVSKRPVRDVSEDARKRDALRLVHPPGGLRRKGFILASFGMALLLALLVLSLQWLPFAELLSHSSRQGGLSYRKAVELSLRPADLLGLIAPRLFFVGESGSFHPWPGAAGEARYYYSLYIGMLGGAAFPFSLAALRARDRHAQDVFAALVLVAIGLFMALGRYNPVYSSLFEHVPVLRTVRFPEKFLSLSLFFLVPCLGVGVDRMTRSRGAGRSVAIIGLFLLVLLFIIPVFLLKISSLFLTLVAGGTPQAWLAFLDHLLPSFRLQALFLALFGGILFLFATWGPRRLLLVSWVVLLALDFWFGVSALSPSLPSEAMRSPPFFATQVPSAADVGPVHLASLYAPEGIQVPDGFGQRASYAWFKETLYPNTGLMYGFSYGDGSRAIRLDLPNRYFASLIGRPLREQLDPLRRAGVAFLVTDNGTDASLLSALPGVRALAAHPLFDLRLWRLEANAPRVWRARGVRRVRDAAEARALIFEDRVRPGEVVLSPEAGFFSVDDLGEGTREAWRNASSVEGESREDIGPDRERAVEVKGKEEVSWEALPVSVEEAGSRWRIGPFDQERASVIVIRQGWDPGWRAALDGDGHGPLPIMLANGYQMAIRVEAGRHREVVLTYRPVHWKAGVVFSGVGLLLCVGLLFAPLRKK